MAKEVLFRPDLRSAIHDTCQACTACAKSGQSAPKEPMKNLTSTDIAKATCQPRSCSHCMWILLVTVCHYSDWIETDELENTLSSTGGGGGGSNWKSVLSGVPQGSVLGPILFLIYINDLDDDITSKVLKFADDTKVFRKIKSDADRQQLQDDLNKLTEWSEKWQMLFNYGKCKCLHTGHGNV